MEDQVQHPRHRKLEEYSKEVKLLKNQSMILHEAAMSHIENILSIADTINSCITDMGMLKSYLKLMIKKHSANKRIIKDLNRCVSTLRKQYPSDDHTVKCLTSTLSLIVTVSDIVAKYLSYNRDLYKFDKDANKNTSEHLYKLIKNELFINDFLNKDLTC